MADRLNDKVFDRNLCRDELEKLMEARGKGSTVRLIFEREQARGSFRLAQSHAARYPYVESCPIVGQACSSSCGSTYFDDRSCCWQVTADDIKDMLPRVMRRGRELELGITASRPEVAGF